MCLRAGSSASPSPAQVSAALLRVFLSLQDAVLAPRDTALFEVVSSQVVESPHPYLDSQDVTHAIKLPDESAVSSIEYMEVTFDSRCRTESNCDYVSFWQDGTRQGLQKYHGRDPGVWAGVGATEVLRVKGSCMEARFHSDGSNNDWGYKFTVSFYAKPSICVVPFYKVVSPVMSCLPLVFFLQHGLHGVVEHSPSDPLYKLFAMYVDAFPHCIFVTFGQVPQNIDGSHRHKLRAPLPRKSAACDRRAIQGAASHEDARPLQRRSCSLSLFQAVSPCVRV